jgi:signal transduction histidine kinase
VATALLLGSLLVAAELRGIGGVCLTATDLHLFIALIAILSACLLAAHFLKKSELLGLPLGFAVVAFLVFALYFPVSSITALVFTMYVAVPLSLYLTFPKGAFASIALLAAVLVFRFGLYTPESMGQRSAAFRDVLLLVLAPLFVSFSLSALAAFRAELDRIAESLRTVTRLNLTYQDYNASVEEKSALKERLRITRDIHDIVGYALTNTIMTLRAASLMCDVEPGRVKGFLENAKTDAERAHEQVRSALGELRRREIRSVAGPGAIARVVRSFKAATGAEVHIDFGSFDWAISGEAAFAVSHFVQEGMLNAVSHGGATWISVDFGETEDGLRVTVRDNGGGAKTVHEGIGIAGMRERIEKLGGDLEYASTAGGFSIEMRLPIERPEAEARRQGAAQGAAPA